jgi:alpha-galactosidase
MLRRSVVQTRSDSACAPGRAEWDQAQTHSLNLYLPLHATIGWEPAAYQCRSSANAGFCAEWDILDPQFPLAQARACIHEIDQNRQYWTGDYYPLTPWTLDADRWMAWQLHRADLDQGMVLAFRHKDCPYPTLQVELRGLKPNQKYRVQFIDDQHRIVTRTLAGRELSALELRLPTRHSSLLLRYAPRQSAAK